MPRNFDYGKERKVNRGLRMTDNSWEGWKLLAEELNIPRSEIIERIGRKAQDEEGRVAIAALLKLLIVE